MTDSKPSRLTTILTLAILAAFAAYVVRELAIGVGHINKDVGIAVLGGIFSVLAIVIGKLYEIQLEVSARLHDHKVALYEPYIAKYAEVLYSGAEADSDRAAELAKEYQTALRSFTPSLLLWGSEGVIHAFNDMMRQANPDFATDAKLWEGLIKEMRRDLGHRYKGLAHGDIIQVFVKEDVRPKLSGREAPTVGQDQTCG